MNVLAPPNLVRENADVFQLIAQLKELNNPYSQRCNGFAVLSDEYWNMGKN
jgi:hypothetical protein